MQCAERIAFIHLSQAYMDRTVCNKQFKLLKQFQIYEFEQLKKNF